MKQHTIASFDDFHTMVTSHFSGNFVYRGESQATYNLQPKIGRPVPGPARRPPGLEESMLEAFRRRARPYLNDKPSDDWEWLSIAQHHGLATRLLDWTANPLVAAFFAVRDQHGSDSVIYALDLENVAIVNLELSPFSLTEVALLRPAHATRRVVAQNGVFTVHAHPDEVFSNAGLKRYLIKEECTIDLMVTLDCYGINCASLFPDLDGVAKHINQDHLIF